MSAIRPDLRTESVLPEELRPKHYRIAMGLEELSRTSEWRALPPYVKRILTSYLTEDAGKWESAVARYYVTVEPEQHEKIAKKISEDPLVREVLRLQSGAQE